MSAFRSWFQSISMAILLLLTLVARVDAQDEDVPETQLAETISSLDGSSQPLLWWAPETATRQPTPLFVFLHSWSADYTQDNSKWLRECVAHGWIWLHPNFRGINQTPAACGSPLARQDILDAVDFACRQWKVDRSAIYLAGVSGGGHMSLLMAGHHPDRFSAVSAWVGPTDLAEWHRFHTVNGQPQKYAVMIEKSLGGPPGTSPAIDAAYRDRSPVFHLDRSGDLPISIWAGIEDGHFGSVPVSHSLHAFNAIARGHGNEPISDQEITELVTRKSLSQPRGADQISVPGLPRKVLLHRQSRTSSVTLFEGGHESLPEAAFLWLKKSTAVTKP